MYPKFIEVHAAGDGIAVAVNVENVIGFSGDGKGGGCFRMTDESMWQTKESYDELKALITDCGCLIRKADPRLDTEHPLTMDDLMTMVGEPVWNSNNGQWMLVNRIDDVAGTDFAILTESSGIGYDFDEAMLKAKPLYRMKKEVAGSKRRDENDDSTG